MHVNSGSMRTQSEEAPENLQREFHMNIIISPETHRKKSWKEMIIRRYSLLLAKYPWVVIMATLILVFLAATTSFIKKLGANPLPDFSKPSKGLEARGTTISRRIISFNNLKGEMPGIEALATSTASPALAYHLFPFTNGQKCTLEALSYMSSKTVYTAVHEGDSLLNAKKLIEICKMEEDIVRIEPLFRKECVREHPIRRPGRRCKCCPSLSIGYYAAILGNKTDCRQITDQDVEYLKEIITNSTKTPLNATFGHRNISNGISPNDVIMHIILNIMQFMVDKDFAKNPGNAKLKYTMVFSPIINPKREFLEKLYETKLQDKHLPEQGGVRLAAYDFLKMKSILYEKQLLVDVWYLTIAAIFILVLMWIYCGSLLISLFGFTSVAFALTLSYWLYSVVFRLAFFPFLNVLTAVFVVGIGADDIFVYVLAWKHARKNHLEPNPDIATIAQWTEYALNHAAAAMFVTSFTTATAFYAGISSNITALQCFSIYAGTSILTNYLLMITWLPALIVMQQRFIESYSSKPPRNKIDVFHDSSAPSPTPLNETGGLCCLRVTDIPSILKKYSDVIFERLLPWVVVKFRFLWLIILFMLVVFGVISMAFYPKLHLPKKHSNQLFVKEHVLERYHTKIKQKLQIENALSTKKNFFPVIFVWGVQQIDNGYFLDPNSTGSTSWDDSFDVTGQDAQRWMLNFCKEVKNSSLYHPTRNRNSWCFMEDFDNYLRAPCSLSATCCNRFLPMAPADFKRCTVEYLNSRKQHHLPIKLNEDGSVKAMIFAFQSTKPLAFTHEEVGAFWRHVTSWADQIIFKMPETMKNAWVISNIFFYDLQKSIANGTVKTIAVSIGISAIVLLFTTGNLLITIYAIVTITAIVTVTVGSLVMAGWRLDVFESMTMAVGVGLAIDFTLHYGVAYFSGENSLARKDRVKDSLWHVGSAVTMGTITTFLAGLTMMPSVIHVYIQLGHFLMLIMASSWFCSTFFFLSLCAIAGPQGHKGNIARCCKGNPTINYGETMEDREMHAVVPN